MNISITPTAEALLEQLMALGYDDPETIIEQALECFHGQQKIDTTIGFPDLTEAAIVQENDARWRSFQQNPEGIPQSEVEALFANYNNPS
jgi:hypothetical protein